MKEVDLSALLAEFTEAEAAPTLAALPNVSYRVKKASNNQSIVLGSVAAISLCLFAIVGLVAYLTDSDPAPPVPPPKQAIVQPINNSNATASPPTNAAPPASDAKVAPSAVASSSAKPTLGKSELDQHEDAHVDSAMQSMAVPAGVTSSSSVASVSPNASEPAVSPASADGEQTPRSEAAPPSLPEVPRKELVTEIELPSLGIEQSDATQIGEGPQSTADLGYLDDGSATGLRISIDEPRVKQHANTTFYTRHPDPKSNVWEIRLKAEATGNPESNKNSPTEALEEQSQLDASSEGFDDVVATLQLDDSGLKFRWVKTNRATMAEQLRNCALVLTSDSLAHRIQLRPALVDYMFMFDLSKSSQAFEVADEHLPRIDAIRFQVSSIQLQSVPFELEPTDGIISKGETLKISTSDGGIPIEFQFVLSASASKVTVKFVPRHQLGRRWYPFTGGQVHGAIDGLERALADGRGRYGAAQSAIGSLPGQISSIESRMRADRPDYSQLVKQRTVLVRQLNSAQGAARRLSKSIPEMEAKLPQLNSLAALGKRIHLQGRLDFRAYIPLEEGELILLKTGTETPPSIAEKAKE